MIKIYSTKAIGSYHKILGTPFQDACAFVKTEEGYVILAVADGVGSCARADIASKSVVETIIRYCKEKLRQGMSEEEILEVIRWAFLHSDYYVTKKAEENGEDVNQYQTTLCVGIIYEDSLYFGQAGDSGIVALLQDGHYVPVTEQQRDEFDYVFPLSFGEDYWKFGKLERPVSAVMLMTDGIWENMVPPLLQGRKPEINVPLAELVMNHFDDSEEELDRLEEEMQAYWAECPEEYTTDDKTTVVYFDTDKKPVRLEDNYYETPDWETIVKESMSNTDQ